VTAGLVVLVSGGGRSLENLVDVARRGELDARVDLVVADRPGIGALERCARLGLEVVVLEPKALGGMAEFSREVFRRAEAAGSRFVVLAGFLRLLAIPAHWRGRVVNIHPALLPYFGGKGMYGDHVHAAVLAAGRTESGCTVHLVDDHYDEGTVLLQERVPVLPGDTVATLAARVFEAEKRALPEALRRLIAADAARRSH
jgi:phosphoribosylglycinamide formyltransferase 1